MRTDATRALRNARLRATPQRLRVLALLADDRPVSADELVRAGKGAFDLTTAYRTLDAFVTKGLARRVEADAGRMLFERAGGAHHHHAVCTSCGVIRDVSVCVPRGLDAKVKSASGFAAVDAHRLEFFGTCRSCAKK